MAGRIEVINHLILLECGSPNERQLYWQFGEWSNGMFCPQTPPPPMQSPFGMKEEKTGYPSSLSFTWGSLKNCLTELGFWPSGCHCHPNKSNEKSNPVTWLCFSMRMVLRGSGSGMTDLWTECSWQQAYCWNTWGDASEYCFRKDQRFSISPFFQVEKHRDRNYKKPNLTALMASAERG